MHNNHDHWLHDSVQNEVSLCIRDIQLWLVISIEYTSRPEKYTPERCRAANSLYFLQGMQ